MGEMGDANEMIRVCRVNTFHFGAFTWQNQIGRFQYAQNYKHNQITN